MAKKIIIFGTGDLGELAKFYLKKDSNYDPIAYCVDKEYIKEDKFKKLPVIAFEDIEREFPPEKYRFIAPLYDNYFREKKVNEILSKKYKLISYVSSKATIFSKIGKNCFIMENNTIQPYVNFGNNIILWSGNHIGHHSTVKDNVFISSHVVISGHCTINSFCWIGVNATIKDHITLNKGTFVAMSCTITKDTEPNSKYKGLPGVKC